VEGRRSSSGEPSQRDPGAVDELLRLYQGKIFNLAMSILKNESDAEEAAQDVFMTVIRKVGTFQGNSAFYSWIYRICVNTCLMRLRGKRRNETVSIEEFMPVFTDEGMHASRWTTGARGRTGCAQRGAGADDPQIHRGAFREVPVVFVLSDVEGLSNEETAKILGLTVPAIKSRLHRARLYLREQLSRYLQEGRRDDAMNCKELAYMLADYFDGTMDSGCTKNSTSTFPGASRARRSRRRTRPSPTRPGGCVGISSTRSRQRSANGWSRSSTPPRSNIPKRSVNTGSGRAGPAGKSRGARRGGDRREALLGHGDPFGDPLRRLQGVRGVFRRVSDNRHPPAVEPPEGIRSHLIALMQTLPPAKSSSWRSASSQRLPCCLPDTLPYR